MNQHPGRAFIVAITISFAASFTPTAQKAFGNPDGSLKQEQVRQSNDEKDLKFWLQNMAWHHRYTNAEMQQVTGLNEKEVTARLKQFGISEDTRPERPTDQLLVLPYPGGRHPRIGFLDGAINPQRETKISVFCPWDDHSYAVLDVPEAIWSNLGLTYLAHTHIDTVWTKQGIELPQQEWHRFRGGWLGMERKLPNGIVFGTKVIPRKDHVLMRMWLTNGTDKPLSDLRVQNCVMLKGASGFEQQTNENKVFKQGYAAVKSADGTKWMITAWDPLHRGWGNGPCPCLHSDPKFEDCPPHETKWLRGWFSFYEGTDLDAELDRIEATSWRTQPFEETREVRGWARDADTNKILPSRVYVQNLDTSAWHFPTSGGVGGTAVQYRKQMGRTASIEQHTTLSGDGFDLHLVPGRYRIRAERGKEYVPAEQTFEVTAGAPEMVMVQLKLKRFANMAKRGWYSGDTHVHRTMEELPNVVMAEDLNVALPLNYWVRDSLEVPAASGPPLKAEPQYVDPTHVIYPINTEYEIFTINKKRHTQGAVFVLNHKEPLRIAAPPSLPIAEEARRQGAILDLDKHSWNWSLMVVPTMSVDLFELSNNHHWRTQFGFKKWTLENAPPNWPEIETDDIGFTEKGWTEFGFQTYYTLLNCGFRMRVTAGTASGVHPVPLGHGRVYVHCGNDFTYEKWIKNLNAGHSFVTQGPLLRATFNDELPGTTWKRETNTNSTKITAEIESVHPLRAIEIIHNGIVAKVIESQPEKTAAGTYRTRIETTQTTKGSAWLAVRCFEDLPNGKVSFAHTNPVFIDVKNHPLRPRKDRVQFFVDRMEAEVTRNTGVLSKEAIAEFVRARDTYKRILKTAQ